MNRQKVILAALLVAFVCSLAYSFLRSPKQREAAPQPAAVLRAAPAARRRAPAPAPKAAEQSALHLALLERQPPHLSGARRNIFSPIFREELKAPPFKPLPPPPPKPVKALPPPPPPVRQAPAVAPPPPTPEQAMESELAKFTFLGFLKKNGEKTVFLSGNNEIFLARKGSKIGNNFVVSDVTDDALTIRSVPGGREVVIPLLDNRPLRRTHRTP